MVQPFEFEFDYSPAWLHVGQHMHWTPRLENLAYQYVRKSLGVEDSSKTPPVRVVAVLPLFKMYIDNERLVDCYSYSSWRFCQLVRQCTRTRMFCVYSCYRSPRRGSEARVIRTKRTGR